MEAATHTNGGDGFVGQAMRRKEDPRFITRHGPLRRRHALPGMLHMAIVRSPEAHAAITSIDTSEAASPPGRRRRLHRPRTCDFGGGDPDGLGAARASTSTRPTTCR